MRLHRKNSFKLRDNAKIDPSNVYTAHQIDPTKILDINLIPYA